MRRRSWSWIAFAMGVAGIVFAAVGWAGPHESDLPVHFAVVEAGHLYRSGQPSRKQLERAVDAFGIRTLLVLRKPNYRELEAERAFAAERGLDLVNLPISSTRPLAEPQLQALRALYADPSRHPILAHCEHGVARTGVAVALWRMEQEHWSGERAVDEMLERGYPERPKNAEMRARLRHWRSGDADLVGAGPGTPRRTGPG